MRPLHRRRRHALAVAVLLLAGLAACFGPGEELTPGRVGPIGGKVAAGESGWVDIPAGALQREIVITAEEAEVTLPAPLRALGPAIALGPEGLRFERPVRVGVRVSEPHPDVAVYTAPKGGTRFTRLQT
ncbi:MAG: hypothetical protein ACK4N5_06530, partial [Myxococcales bacterium]